MRICLFTKTKAAEWRDQIVMSSMVKLIKETISEWSEDKASRLAAALSYYTIFSLAPLMVIIIAITSLFLGEEAARGAISGQIDQLIGQQGALAVEDLVQNANFFTQNNKRTSILATLVGVATLLLGATGVFGQLYDALNTIWEVQPITNKKGIIASVIEILQQRFLSLTMVLGIGFLLLVSLVFSALVAGLTEMIGQVIPAQELFGYVLDFVLSVSLISVLFALMFKFVPDARIAWRDAFMGGVVTALLFTLGKILIGIYLGNSGTASSFGAAGSLVLILLWVYYSAQILFLGAEFTQVYARTVGHGIEPNEDAILLPDMTQIKEQAIKAAEQGKATIETSQSGKSIAPSPRRESERGGPFAAAFVGFWVFVTGILVGLIRGSSEKRA
jgi:membrane protein